jgi:hypothetical protein
MVVQNLASGGIKIEQKSPDLIVLKEEIHASFKKLALSIVIGASLVANAILVLELGKNFGFFGDISILTIGTVLIFLLFKTLIR